MHSNFLCRVDAFSLAKPGEQDEMEQDTVLPKQHPRFCALARCFPGSMRAAGRWIGVERLVHCSFINNF